MKENNTWVVYLHTNQANNKKYVGITSKKPEHRWNYGKGYKYNNHFWNAIQKYGWDNFEHEILLSGLSASEACEEEKRLIALYQSNNPSFGYNNTSGGDSGFTMSDETRNKISEANKGEKNSNYGVSPKERMDEETYKRWLHKQQTNKPRGKDNPQYGVSPKDRMSEEVYQQWLINQKAGARKGEDHPMYGISPKERMDEETYTQWREKRKNNKKSIPVRCVETEVEYRSARDAERATGIGHTDILKSCKSIDHSHIAGGYHWCYASDNESRMYIESENKGRRYVKCIELNMIYKDTNDAGRQLGIDGSTINKCCKGQVGSVKGYHFEYIYMFLHEYINWIDKNNKNLITPGVNFRLYKNQKLIQVDTSVRNTSSDLQKLSQHAFVLYNYLLSIEENIFPLSTNALYKNTALYYKTYTQAFQELIDNNYMVPHEIILNDGRMYDQNTFIFYPSYNSTIQN